ncbi:MAG: iron-sulfur cluster assembly accessory protein [Bacteroidia bacterium]|nr:iron-sulfur cluster assembly accessory protein [Bacteroidia bacterium]
MTEVQMTQVTFTPSAIAALKEIIVKENRPADQPLRVGVEGGGCSGLTYLLDFDEKGEFDEEFDIDGLKVVLDKRHSLYVYGMEVDFQAGLNDRGFTFKNPNAKESCGCGTSFSV